MVSVESRRCYATANVKIRRVAKTRGKVGIPSKGPKDYVARSIVLSGTRQALEKQDIRDVIDEYTKLGDATEVLHKSDVTRIAQLLHLSITARTHASDRDKSERRKDMEELTGFAERMIKDIRNGILSPVGEAHVHLITALRRAEAWEMAYNFWNWLKAQDDRFTTPGVYGSAIELLAYQGAPLRDSEALYAEALKRFPGNFNEYHLSPEAIVPNREEATTVQGIPMALLQGILTARLLRGDSRNAYLAFDTALRLYPAAVPQRFFDNLITERPFAEGYNVFLIACRAGIQLTGGQFKKLLNKIRTSSDLSSLHVHVLTIRAMLNATYMYAGAGGVITSNSVTELLIAVTQILRVKGLDFVTRGQISTPVLDLIRRMLEVLARFGAMPGLAGFNSIINNVAGFGRRRDVIETALSDAKALGLEPNMITRRSVLTAAGKIGDGDLVEESWRSLVQARIALGSKVDSTDMYILIKAAFGSDQVDFARESLIEVKDAMSDHERDNIAAHLDSDPATWKEKSTKALPFELAALFEELGRILADIAVIEKLTAQTRVQDFKDQTLLMTLLPPTDDFRLSELETRRLYDELTTEPRPSPPAEELMESPQAQPGEAQNRAESAEGRRDLTTFSTSPTGLPFGTLRYENWKSVNGLLAQADQHDKTYNEAVDNAIADGTAPPKRDLDIRFSQWKHMPSYGLSDLVRAAADAEEHANIADAADPRRIKQGRSEILRLRGRQVNRG